MDGAKEYRSLGALAGMVPGRLDRARQPVLFDRFDWVASLHRHCQPERAPRILHAREGDAEGWMFLADKGDGRATALANWYSFSWAPLFTGAGAGDVHVRHRLMRDMGRTLIGDSARLDLYPILSDGGLLDGLRKALGEAGWVTIARAMGRNHYLDVRGRSFADYWAARPARLRNLVRRKAKSGLGFEIHHAFSDSLWADYVAVYDRSWKPSEPSLDFLRELALGEGEAGTLRLGIARHEGKAVAAQLWTVENGNALIHKLAHDAASDALSPGTLLSHAMFRAAIDEDRVARIDYGTWDNAHKTAWMEVSRPLYRLDAFNPSMPRSWLPAAKTAISQLVGHRLRR